MIQKPCACFGYVLLQNTYPKGNVYEVQTSSTSSTMLFLTKGHVVYKNKTTGELLDEHFPGAFGTEWVDGLYEVVAMEESTAFCFDPNINRGYIPETMPVVMEAGETYYFESGAKFFLCQGTATVNGTDFTGPYQVAFKSAKPMEAVTDVYGVIVK